MSLKSSGFWKFCTFTHGSLSLENCFPGEQPLQVARCTKIINADSDDPKYIINVKQFAKFVVDLGDQVAPTDIEEGMRVG